MEINNGRNFERNFLREGVGRGEWQTAVFSIISRGSLCHFKIYKGCILTKMKLIWSAMLYEEKKKIPVAQSWKDMPSIHSSEYFTPRLSQNSKQPHCQSARTELGCQEGPFWGEGILVAIQEEPPPDRGLCTVRMQWPAYQSQLLWKPSSEHMLVKEHSDHFFFPFKVRISWSAWDKCLTCLTVTVNYWIDILRYCL